MAVFAVLGIEQRGNRGVPRASHFMRLEALGSTLVALTAKVEKQSVKRARRTAVEQGT
jgi:hypothetical protein